MALGLMTRVEMMSCGQIQELLDDFISKKLDDRLKAQVQSHLDVCPDCKGLVSILSDDLPSFDAAAPAHLAASVLERTSGSACGAAIERLPDFVDRELHGVESDLVSLHLHDCSDCRAIECAIRQLAVDLPTLAQADLGPQFTRQVLAATSESVSKLESLAAVWRRIVQRQRFAFEAAYVGIVVLVLIVGLNGTGEMGKAAARLVRTAPEQTVFASSDIVENAAAKTAMLTGLIKDKVARGAHTGVTSGRVLVGEPTHALVETADGVSAWIKDRWTGLADRLENQKKTKEANEIDKETEQ
jgi:predicted anti-sigma-YlaC factor YlaD